MAVFILFPYNGLSPTKMRRQRKTLVCNRLHNKGLFNEAGKIRTSDPQIRNLMLYPAELQPHKNNHARDLTWLVSE